MTESLSNTLSLIPALLVGFFPGVWENTGMAAIINMANNIFRILFGNSDIEDI